MLRVKGIGLRVKFTFFIVLLVVSVVVLVAIPLGRNVLRRQEQILVSGLEERVALLVEGLVTGARPALRNPLLTSRPTCTPSVCHGSRTLSPSKSRSLQLNSTEAPAKRSDSSSPSWTC